MERLILPRNSARRNKIPRLIFHKARFCNKETLINPLYGRITIAEMPRGARNLNIFLYMPRFLRSVRKPANRQTLHIIYYFVLFCRTAN